MRACHDGWGTGAIFAPSGRGRIQVIWGTNLRLTQWLPGKLAEGHAPHHPFDCYRWRCSAVQIRTINSWSWGKGMSVIRVDVGEAGAGQAGDVQRARELAP